MKFGHLKDIKDIEFSLPPDHPMTQKVLKKTSKKPEVYVGCPEWGEEGFLGKIYPKGTPKKDFLKVYATQFNAIELNATGYQIPNKKTVEGWKGVAPRGFKFCPKVSRPISHVNPLAKDKAALKQFCENITAFEEHLGTAFLQLPPSFSSQRYDQLINLLDLWDESIPLFVEVRHEDWFSNEETLNQLFEEMRKRKIGTVITDTAGRRDALHMCLTTPSAFIRFDGQDLDRTDYVRLDEWALRVKEWIEAGLKTLYFFMHTPKKYLTPYQANHFIERINKLCDLDLKPANIMDDLTLDL